jgi:hypothetical protein
MIAPFSDAEFRPSPGTPARVDPRTYLALNRFEQVLEENQFDLALRYFRKRWRAHLVVLSVDHHWDFAAECLRLLAGSRLYGPWWNPGMLPRRLSDSLIIVHRVIRHTNLEDIFS